MKRDLRFLCAFSIIYSLYLPILLLKLALHFEIQLSFSLNLLLLHISKNSRMHCLRQSVSHAGRVPQASLPIARISARNGQIPRSLEFQGWCLQGLSWTPLT